MLDNTRTRLKTYLEDKGYSVASLEKAIGAGNGSIGLFLSGKNKGLGNNLEKILIHFDNLSSRWLLTGEGPSEIDYHNHSVNPKSKNDLYIKPEGKGVRIDGEKGGQDWGQDSSILENEKHIKQPKAVHSMELPPEEVEGIRRAEHARRKAKMEEERQRLMAGFYEPDRAKYGDLQDAFDNTLRQQRVIFSQLLKKIEALEGNNQGNESERTGEGAELPKNGPFNSD